MARRALRLALPAGARYVLSGIMSFLSLLVLAFALAADSFAAAVARGARAHRPRLRHALMAAALFGAAQMLMPLIGWQVGSEFRPAVERIDHWIAFAILCGLGAKMIVEGVRSGPEPAPDSSAFTLSALLLAAVATSIDALVAGFGFGVLNLSVLVALAVIGATTFVLSFAGVYVGTRFGRHLGQYVEIGGGLVLIGIGAKILIDHTS